MSFDPTEIDPRLYKGLPGSRIDQNTVLKLAAMNTTRMRKKLNAPISEAVKLTEDYQYQRYSLSSQGINGKKKQTRTSYFSIESLLLLICLTALLLILPLILPPLPPPPFLLLLLPIGILGLLMILAFMPSNVRDLTYTYM